MFATKEKSLTFSDLALISQGHAAFQLLWSSVNVGVFDYLSSHPESTFNDIKKAVKLQHQPLKILMNGLITLSLVNSSEGLYSNAPLVEETLVSSNPNNMIDVLGWQHHIVYPGLFHFLPSLKENTNKGLDCFSGEGDNLYARLSSQPELEKIFQNAMASLSRSANKILLKHLNLIKVKHLVDAGGGNGENAIAFTQHFHDLKVTVFDSETVCQRAKQNIEDHQLSSRIATYPGNLFETSFPSDIDAILFAHMLTIWEPKRNILLLKKAYDALPKGGRVIIFNMMANNDGNGPISAALGSPYFLSIATGGGMLYSWNDYHSFLKEAGFETLSDYRLEKDHGLIIGVK